jgi:hypothetical protein
MKPANQIFFLSDNHNRQVNGCYGHPPAAARRASWRSS